MYKKSSTGWLKHLDFMILDIICLQLAFIMGFFSETSQSESIWKHDLSKRSHCICADSGDDHVLRRFVQERHEARLPG